VTSVPKSEITVASPGSWLLPADHLAGAARTPRVVALGGDGIGPEVVDATIRCLEALGAPLEIVTPPHGAETRKAAGTPFPEELRGELDRADAILFGAVDTGPEGSADILRYIRFELDTYANLRPAQSLAQVPARTGDGVTNLVIVRELTEGMYPGREGDLSALKAGAPEIEALVGRALPDEGAFALRVISERASRRIARYAAELAARRKREGVSPGRVTVVTKENVLRRSDGLFRSICEQELATHPELEVDHVYVDEAARRLVACPETFDVVVTTNLFGDILSDVASEVMGGMPMAPSAGIGQATAYFEACHGSAPDIAGKGVANPSATVLSAAMMLAYLGKPELGDRLAAAVLAAIGAGVRTRDLGGDASTAQITEAICRRLMSGPSA
jgi:isocitrate/isopropylmalate dehydrogenase